MMSGVPVVSVFMLTYNHGRFIAEAIESVLTQEMDYAFELVIGDDASTDDTRLICERYAREYPDTIRYIRNAQNLGGSENGRQVLAACRGRYLARLEGDDYMVGRRRLNDQIAWLEQHPDCMLVYGRARVIDASKTVLSEIPHLDRCFSGDLLEGMLEGNLIPACTAVYRAEILTQLPEWRSHVRYGDYLANTIAADKGKIHCFPEVLAVYRRHADSMTARDQYHTNLIELIDIHCRFITHNDLSLRGIALSRQAIIQKLHKLKRYSLETGQVINWTELKNMVTPCLEPGTSEAADASLLFGEQDDSVDSGYAFSVILTTYNRPDLLRDALASVGKQSFRDFEVILINDNGEPVEHLLAAYDYPITYIRQGRNRGLSAARNAGLALARGRYIVYLDDDDIYLPNHLAVLAEAYEQHPGSVIYTGVEYVNEKLEDGQRIELGRGEPFKHEVFDRDRLFVQNYIPVNTWAHPRTMLATVGEFDTGLAAFEDWDMLLRLATRYPFVHVPTVTSEVHTRAPEAGGDHMLGRERKNFPALYRELYQRYSGSASDTLQTGRQQMLESLGVPVDKADEAPNLEQWLAARLPTEVQSRLISERLEQAQGGVMLGVLVVDAEGDQDALIATVASLGNERHLYASLKIVALTTLDTPSTSWDEKLHYVPLDERGLAEQVNAAVSSLQADWFMLVKAGSVFTPSGLMVAALDLLAAPDCRAVYGDELLLQENGSLGIALRPGLNLDMLLSLPGVMARHWLFNRTLWQQSGGFDTAAGKAFELDYILRLILDRGLEGMGHISEPLLKAQVPRLSNCLDERDVIVRHLQSRGYQQADVGANRPGHYEINYGHPELAKVSILVSADGGLAKIRRCVESVLEKTSYPAYEVLILDHDAQDPATSAWLQGVEQLGASAVKVVRLPQGLSLVQARNRAAEQASGDYLLWLDCGVAVLSDDWLHALMNHGLRPEVGAVGAKLITGDSKVASGGIVLGLNGPLGHVGCGLSLEAAGYLQRLQIDQNQTALNGSCLLLRRSLFGELGGFDETPEMAPWADVDLCLRLHSAGYFNVWTPRVPLLITADIAVAATVEQEDAIYARWLPLLARDPVYNPNFKLEADDEFVLAPSLLSWNPLSSWKPMPRVLAHPADSFGCGHYRVINPLKALNNAGVVDGTFAWGHLSLTELERFAPDSIVLQRQIDAEQIEGMRRMQAFSRAFKVYELDDYLPNLPMKSVHRDQMPKDILKSLRKGLGFVDRFVVSTEPLAEALSGLHGDIRVVENRLSVEWWKGLSSRRRRGRKPRVGWAGGVSHTGDLELIADVVKELAGEVEWVFFGMCPEKIRPYVQEVHSGVPIDMYPSMLASLDLDLALAPVEQNLFNECKSNLRLLEYGACGFPVVCSDVRCYQGDRLPVTRVKNRFKDWVDAIRMHISDLDETARLGDQLRQTVHCDWMLEGGNLDLWRNAWVSD